MRSAGRGVVREHGSVGVDHHLSAGRVAGPSPHVRRVAGQRGQGSALPGRRLLRGEATLRLLVPPRDVKVHRAQVAPARHPSRLGPLPARVPLRACLDRRELVGTLLRGDACAEDEHAVVVPPVVELAPLGDGVRVGPVSAADLPQCPLRLGRRRGQGELEQALLGGRFGDAGEGTRLRVGDAPREEGGGGEREPAQRPGDPHVLPGGPHAEAALPRAPVRAGPDPRTGPPVPLVELRHEQEPGGRGGGQPDGARGDLAGQFGERTLGRCGFGHGRLLDRVFEHSVAVPT